MSLSDGYDLVEQADRLTAKHQFKDASELYKQASKVFSKHINETDNNEINRALELLVAQHQRRAAELSVMQNRTVTLRKTTNASTANTTNTASTTSQSSSTSSNYSQTHRGKDNVGNFLASQRGLPVPSNLRDNLTSEEVGDPIAKFQIQVSSLLKPPNHLTSTINTVPSKDLKLSGKSIEELEIENASLKNLLSNYSENLHSYESYQKNLKTNLHAYLNALKGEIQLQDRRKTLEFEAKIESLESTNKKLETQIKKLKERWNDLVESAKRRRDDTKSSTPGTTSKA